MARTTKATNDKETKVYIVESPVKNYCGVGAAGVQFAYGRAEVREGWVLDWYKDHGYRVTPKAAEGDSSPGDPPGGET